ncbi:M15 family metallopeptidase [Aquabacter cavernae]|uniref:M15 family metallopeptidase n=1 Tax=Aquabacter cavernae TaxID=2496029 RepID=UPI000F8D558C|nr:M15 family metallopeptidase [Aquabacter cavernae]
MSPFAQWPLQKDCLAFYGSPTSRGWEASNLVVIKCPWVLRYEGKPVKGIRIHHKCAFSLKRVLDAIWDAVGRSQAEIDRIGMSTYGGSFEIRDMRGGKSTSMHSYGCALDFDPDRNGLGDKTPAMDKRVIAAFEVEGWEWGGHWSRPDGMHFQAARTRAEPKRLALAGAPLRGKQGTIVVDELAPNHTKLAPYEVEAVQRRLIALNIWPGKVDGIWGNKTTGAVSTFQSWQGLPVSGDYDDATRDRLADASLKPMPVAPARADTTVQDLRKQGSQTVAAADKGRIVAWGVGLFGGGGALDKLGALDGMKGALDKVASVRPLVDGIADLGGWLISAWPIALIAAAVALWLLYGQVIRRRLADEVSGRIA